MEDLTNEIKNQINHLSPETVLFDVFQFNTNEDLEYLYRTRIASVPYNIIGTELHRTAEACKSKWLKTNWTNMDFYNNIDYNSFEQK